MRSCCSPTRTVRCGTRPRSPRPLPWSTRCCAAVDRARTRSQAAIACLHGVAPSYAETDWPQIAELYRLLEKRWPTPVVRVNRAVAVAEVAGPAPACTARRAGRRARRNAGICTGRRVPTSSVGSVSGQPRPTRTVRRSSCPCNDSDRRFLQRRLDSLDGLREQRRGQRSSRPIRHPMIGHGQDTDCPEERSGECCATRCDGTGGSLTTAPSSLRGSPSCCRAEDRSARCRPANSRLSWKQASPLTW